MNLVVHAKYPLDPEMFGFTPEDVAAALTAEGGGTLHGVIETVYPGSCSIVARVEYGDEQIELDLD